MVALVDLHTRNGEGASVFFCTGILGPSREPRAMDSLEESLVEKAKGDPRAFGELYELYVDRIYNYVYHRVGNHNDAQDLTSRTFYRALSNIHRYQNRGAPFVAWLYRIAHNLVANWHRDHSRRKVISLDELVIVSPSDGAPERLAERAEDLEWLRQAIRKLNPDRQELLILKHSEGLSNAEIGRVMGRSEGAIKSLYHRTLLALKHELKRRGKGRGKLHKAKNQAEDKAEERHRS